ncbi:hypothetical protein [Streptomyces sp. NPDC018031]|uniref:hypothetical protein n=1 Tax=Streptomyces sp. NPDC018031 TaxID=3365033 RepID=UPI0037B023FF
MSVVMLTGGCASVDETSSKRESEPEMRNSREVVDEVGRLSSRILEMTRVKAKVTEPGPYASTCPGSRYEDDLRWVRHPWSMYGVDREILQKGWENLLQQLPEQGDWKVVRRGRDKSRNRNLELYAVHVKTQTKLEVAWLSDPGGDKPLLEVTLYSRCYRMSVGKSTGS